MNDNLNHENDNDYTNGTISGTVTKNREFSSKFI